MQNMDNVFYVNAYCKEGQKDDEGIKACLAAADALPYRTIVFDGRDYRISEAIILPSDTTVLIDGCMIKQVDETFDNVFRGNNLSIDTENPFGTPLGVTPIRNIKILGKNGAKIEGCDINRRGYHPIIGQEQDMVGDFWGWRTLQIALSHCDGFEIAGLSFTKTRCWAMSFDFCANGYIHDIHFETKVKNGDGVNFRVGCHHCTVENITGFTSDDTVACTGYNKEEKIYPSKNYIYPIITTLGCTHLDERGYDIHDITIKGIYTGGDMHGIICLANGGVQIYNIHICDVVEGDKGSRESTIKLYAGYGTGYQENDLHDITVENVIGKFARNTILCNTKMNGVRFKNICHRKADTEIFSISHPDGVEIQ